MKNTTIRRFMQSDLESVRTLHEVGLKQMDAYIGDPRLNRDLDTIFDVYLNNEGEFLVAVCNEKIIGMGGLRKVDKNTAEIKRLRVTRTYQGKGIGKTILDELIRRAKELGYQKLIIDTTTKQIPAQRLFEKVGFRETRRERLGKLEQVFYEMNIS